MAVRSEAPRQKIKFLYFDAKLRFALLASLRSAIFREIKIDNKLVTFPARVNLFLTFSYLPFKVRVATASPRFCQRGQKKR